MSDSALVKSYTVKVLPEGNAFRCREDEFVLTAMLRSRSGPLTCGCCGGGCGICKMKIESGSFEAVKKMSRAHVSEAEQEKGIVLICCIQPRGDMVITRAYTNKQT